MQLHVPEALARSEITRARAASAAACRSRSPATYRDLSLESVLSGGIKNQNENQQMSKKRGSGTLPPPLSLARYTDRRPISSIYVDGCSLGDTPMTFTPAPRATSIA